MVPEAPEYCFISRENKNYFSGVKILARCLVGKSQKKGSCRWQEPVGVTTIAWSGEYQPPQEPELQEPELQPPPPPTGLVEVMENPER